MSHPLLFWHRKDLRLTDNLGLANACRHHPKTIGVFCLDPGILQADDIAPVRVAYLLGCLAELQAHYVRLGGTLLILQGDPVDQIPRLAKTLQAQAVYWNQDVEPYAYQRDAAVARALLAEKIAVEMGWDQLLHSPGEVLTGAGNPYTVYSPFWKNWSARPKAVPVPAPPHLQALTDAERSLSQAVGAIALPTLQDLGLHWDNGFLLEPGETAAQERLEWFCDRALYSYDEDRNFPALDGTSMLSAALKFGAIGIRTLWAKTTEAMAQTRSDEARQHIQTWQQELAWREFYQHVLFQFPELANGPYRPQWRHFPWENNEKHFQAWCEGRTGYPIVDAAMRQLNETGWMHNRCRMIVASFLTKDLIIDWRWGEKYFMQHLVDGDLAANNGGWQWSASSGMDPKPLRIFNPNTQAQKFDSEAEYIRRWLPELNPVEPGVLLSGKIDLGDRGSYPAPIVNHQQRQQRFKDLYAQVKAG